MVLNESENRAALAAAKERGARIHGLLDAKSEAIVAEEKRKQLALREPEPEPEPETEPELGDLDDTGLDGEVGEPMRSAGELAQDEQIGSPSAGGGA